MKADDTEATVKKMDVFVVMSMDASDAERLRRVEALALGIKMMLHRLYYTVDLEVAKHPAEDPPFHAALTEFEQRAGLAIDGVFDVHEFEQLSYFNSLANYNDLGITPTGLGKRVHSMDGYISASGTWVIQGDEAAYPNNLAEVDCWRSFRNCIVADGNITTPKPTGSNGAYLMVNTSYYEITSWTPNRVVAESTALCRRNVLTVDVTAEQVFLVKTDLKKTDALCGGLGEMAAPQMTTLEDPFKTGEAHLKSTRALLKNVSKAPLGRIEKLFAEAPAAPKQSK